MNSVRLKLAKAIQRRGDSFTVGGVTRKGLFSLLSADRASVYLTATQAAALGRPIWLAFVAHDDPTALGATVVWDSRSLVVQKALNIRRQDVTVARVLVIA